MPNNTNDPFIIRTQVELAADTVSAEEISLIQLHLGALIERTMKPKNTTSD